MRVRVRFRYDATTGEVEIFQVDDTRDGPPQHDHEARHDAVTRDVARVITPHPEVSEVVPGTDVDTTFTVEPVAEEPARQPDQQRLHD